MSILFDFLPIILMFVAYKIDGIYTATAVAMGASILQVGYLKLARKPVKPMMWVGLGILVVAGSATLLLHDERFIKWKPTILFTAAAIAIGVAQFRYGKNPIASLFNDQIAAPAHVWSKLAVAWIIFFLFSAGMNLVFAFNTSTETWLLFKLFGNMAMLLVFIIAQFVWLMPYLPKDEENAVANKMPDVVVAIAPITPMPANSSNDAAFQEGKS